MRILLVHPPALSPVVLRPLRTVLEAAGHEVAVPDYTAELTVAASWWRRATRECVRAVDALLGSPPVREGARDYAGTGPGPDLLVGYSGSGVLLSPIAASRPAGRVVFLDALLPAEGRETVPSEQVRAFTARLLAEHGGERLPRWTRWWPADDLAALLPDASLREELDATSPELPGDFYDEAVGVSPGWEPDRVDYVQLSDGYAEQAAAAAGRGWVVHRLPSDHLAVVTRPEEIRDFLTG
ncbi:hypothetical protein [Ornithinicoccus hortensis]|uniref:Alpha/beta hydrolase family protein n=1 Tax=Ornithinicoccus hortensis TaxID=82346 RepID=A0A542YVL3_9MICO|nr:hypothetical protein [Ornithinicoccus hortensis]TQL52126.1 hypothetical protein FB467_3297 [Ornithinicoccus hortensis]